jgi:hypothetical protein
MELEELKTQLKELAEVVNQFKSEAVQLKVLEMLADRVSGEGDAPIARKTKRSKGRQQRAEPQETDDEQKKGAARSTGSRSGHGAHSIILRLLDEGFFDKAQTISNITKHASERLGHHLKANECSPTLLRLLRSGRLARTKNKDGQYEYRKA